MIKETLIIMGLFLIVLPVSTKAQTISVGLEPFPPLITEDGKGYSIEMLKAIEAISNYTFTIKIMPYNRAKKELKTGKIDLVGHTPQTFEIDAFYEYAEELEWSIVSKTDLYVIDTNKLHQDILQLKLIGTPRGNKEFFAETFQIPLDNLYDAGNLKSMVKLLQKGRISAFIFARASTMSTLNKLKIPNVSYRQLDNPPIFASFAVRKDSNGHKLKTELDRLIKKVNHDAIFANYLKYMELPDEGVVEVPTN